MKEWIMARPDEATSDMRHDAYCKGELIRCKDCKWFGHEITEELTEYGFYNKTHKTFCYRQLANGMNDAFDVCVDDFCSWAERKTD